MIVRKLLGGGGGTHYKCYNCLINKKTAKTKLIDFYLILPKRIEGIKISSTRRKLILCENCLEKLRKILNGEVKSD